MAPRSSGRGQQPVVREPVGGESLRTVRVLKADAQLGVIFGYAVVCKTRDSAGNLVPYFDDGSLSAPEASEHVSEDEMLKAATAFMKSARAIEREHLGPAISGQVVFAFPVTESIAKALGWQVPQTGLVVGVQPEDPQVLADALAGKLTGFSIFGACEAVPETDLDVAKGEGPGHPFRGNQHSGGEGGGGGGGHPKSMVAGGPGQRSKSTQQKVDSFSERIRSAATDLQGGNRQAAIQKIFDAESELEDLGGTELAGFTDEDFSRAKDAINRLKAMVA